MVELSKSLLVPEPLRYLQLTGPTLSIGGVNASSPVHQHHENWFAQLHGRKAWVVAPADSGAEKAMRKRPVCQLHAQQKPLENNIQRCVLRAGEVLYLPDQWHHGTCNLEGFAA